MKCGRSGGRRKGSNRQGRKVLNEFSCSKDVTET